MDDDDVMDIWQEEEEDAFEVDLLCRSKRKESKCQRKVDILQSLGRVKYM